MATPRTAPAFAEKKQVSFITFCCVLLPRQVIEQVGFLDETLFMYCEDVDYCIRLADAGVPLWFLPDAKIWHKAGRQRRRHAVGVLHHPQHAVSDLQGQKQIVLSGQNRGAAAHRGGAVCA